MPPAKSQDNHNLLLLVSGKVDALAETLASSIAKNDAEFDKLWRHQEDRDVRQSAALQMTADKLAASISAVADKQSDSGKPNIQAIVAVLGLIGAIAVAFIAPIKADISRAEARRDELAKAVLVKEEKIQQLQNSLSVIESDINWMRGEKKIYHQNTNTTTP